jgi:acetate kinase
MKILVLNCGSSSLKFQLIETTEEQIKANEDRLLAHGILERIGSLDAIVSYESAGKPKVKFSKPILKHKEAIETAFECMTGSAGVIGALQEIEGVGHRIVHGGERFHQSVLMEEDVVRQIEGLVDLAPLHNPHNLKGFYASQSFLPHAAHVAVFDTGFHQTLPPKAYVYGLPHIYYSRDKVRRYGFHGLSHRYVSYRFAQIHNATQDDYKLITCHLGNGCSVCAIEHGKSVDTSMGFTPMEGLVMGTRSGDIDPGAVLYLVGREEMGMHEVDIILNKQSGLYGLSGLSNDMRDLITESEQGNKRARLAIEVFCYRVKKYIGAYFAAMDGADAVLFTGGIGENAPVIRAEICESLGALGIQLDAQKNQAAIGIEKEIGVQSAPTRVWVIPTDEELLIARDTLHCILRIPHG